MTKNNRFLGRLAVMVLLLLALCTGAVAEAAGQGDNAAEDSGAYFRIAGRAFSLPDGWVLREQPNGAPQAQFEDTDGRRAICIIRAAKMPAYQTEEQIQALLEQVCNAFDGNSSTTIQVGERRVAVFDAASKSGSGQMTTYAIFLEGRYAFVVQLYIVDATNTMRQQALVAEVVQHIDAYWTAEQEGQKK